MRGDTRKLQRILVACGNPHRGSEYATLLGHEGFELEVVSTGLECLARSREWQPDLLVVCQDLTWGSSAGILTIMHEDRSPSPIPALVFTDDVELTSSQLRPEWGCRVVMAPVTLHKLRRLVREFETRSSELSLFKTTGSKTD
jgi:CheY-like chemotaxis protein